MTIDAKYQGAAVACTTEQTRLGEGVRWDGRRDELIRVDILAGRVYRDHVRHDGSLAPVHVYDLPGTVGMIAPVRADDGWLLGAGRGVLHLSAAGLTRSIAEIAPPGVRMNDGACDPQGRLWAGTMAEDQHPGGAALYRLDQHGRADQMLAGLTISNGVDWSPDGATMYVIDSGPRVVYAFAFDGDRGTIADRCVLIEVPEELGAPDGMTVDAAGDLWVAIYGAGRVHRYSPDGLLRDVYPIPAKQTTCCAFAGEALDRLYVTTGTEGWTDQQRRADPAAGLVYRLETDAVGRAAGSFAPDPGWWRVATS